MTVLLVEQVVQKALWTAGHGYVLRLGVIAV